MTVSILKCQEEIIAGWQGDTEKPKASICCISYNHGPYIEETLKGFLIQETDFPFEILIHDDASRDDTVQIIKKYAERYPQIIRPIYQTTNQYSQGVNVNVVFNFSRVRGDFIALCEGDDYWVDPEKLQKQVVFLEANTAYVMTYTDCVRIGEQSNRIEKISYAALEDLDEQQLQKATPVNTLTVCFRNVLNEEWPVEFSIAKYGDLTLWSMLGDFGKGKYLADIKPSVYRVHEGGLHSTKTRAKQEEMLTETQMALFLYRMKKGDKALAYFFATEVVLGLFKILPLKNKVLSIYKHMGRCLVSVFR